MWSSRRERCVIACFVLCRGEAFRRGNAARSSRYRREWIRRAAIPRKKKFLEFEASKLNGYWRDSEVLEDPFLPLRTNLPRSSKAIRVPLNRRTVRIN